MKKRLIFGIIGRFMIIEAILFLLPTIVSLIYSNYEAEQLYHIGVNLGGVRRTFCPSANAEQP